MLNYPAFLGKHSIDLEENISTIETNLPVKPSSIGKIFVKHPFIFDLKNDNTNLIFRTLRTKLFTTPQIKKMVSSSRDRIEIMCRTIY